jgi:hypothetical protein
MNLHSQLGNIADRESYIAEKLGITIEEARTAIKTSSFGQYRAMFEANADRGFVGTQTTQSSVRTPNTASTMRTPDTPVSANSGISGNTADSKEFDDALVQLNDPTRKSELERIKRTQETNPAQAEKDYAAFKKRNPGLTTTSGDQPSAFDKMFTVSKLGQNEFMRGFNNNIREFSEIARLQELAGIQETATSGGVAAANIATSASIIGDTSDSHKPSVQLRKDNRLNREDKEQQDDKQDKQDTKDKETNSNIERLIKR